MSDARLMALENHACPGAGACGGGQFTANTMAMASEFLGVTRLGSGQRLGPACTRRIAVARDAGHLAMALLQAGVRPRDIMTRHALDNAIAGVAASGGSTNAVLRDGARGKRASRWSWKTSTSPCASALADLKPGGRCPAALVSAAARAIAAPAGRRPVRRLRVDRLVISPTRPNWPAPRSPWPATRRCWPRTPSPARTSTPRPRPSSSCKARSWPTAPPWAPRA